MKRTISGLAVSVTLGLTLLSCNGYNSNTNTTLPSGASRRVFVSDPVFPTLTGLSIPTLVIVDASSDLVTASTVPLGSLLSASVQGAGMMAVSPKRDHTLVFSAPDNKLGLVINSSESLGGAIALPGPTESFVWTDNSTAFVAVPSAAPVIGQPVGAVLQLDLVSGSTAATIPVPGAHYIVPSPDGSKILVFSDNSNAVTVITPSLIGSAQSNSISSCGSSQVAACTLAGFDRPVGAVFDPSGSTAYVLNCGPQCGGAGVGACLTFSLCTSVSVLALTQNPATVVNTVAVPAATIGLLQGSSLYIAGTPALAPDNNCTSVTPATTATTCGRLTVINIQTLSATSVAITDGYHNRMAISPNGQLFIGSKNCTNINVSGGEVRGCLTIANVSSGSVGTSGIISPPDNGDVTGIEPITNRNVVYVCEGGRLRVYDTTTDQLENLQFPPQIVGQAVDVKLADF